jgi:hypothetical protein
MGRHTGTANLSHRADRLPIGISILTILALSVLSWAAVAGIVMLFVWLRPLGKRPGALPSVTNAAVFIFDGVEWEQ